MWVQGKVSGNSDYSAIEHILNKMDRDDLRDPILSYMKASTTVDHGILAAVDLISNRDKYSGTDDLILENACYAILVHNIRDDRIVLNKDGDFLAQLLCLIDRFQAWGRENEYQKLLDEKLFFQKIVLRKFRA